MQNNPDQSPNQASMPKLLSEAQINSTNPCDPKLNTQPKNVNPLPNQMAMLQQAIVSKLLTAGVGSNISNPLQLLAPAVQNALKLNIINPLLQTAQLTQQLNMSALAIQSILLNQLVAFKPEDIPKQAMPQFPMPNTVSSLNMGNISGLFEKTQLGNKTCLKNVSKSKKIRKTNLCGHPERDHYAKNLCYNCYHRHGRNKKPWKCNHDKLYAQGLCQSCYITQYNKKRSEQKCVEKKEEVNECKAPSCDDHVTNENPTSADEPITKIENIEEEEGESIISENHQPKSKILFIIFIPQIKKVQLS